MNEYRVCGPDIEKDIPVVVTAYMSLVVACGSAVESVLSCSRCDFRASSVLMFVFVSGIFFQCQAEFDAMAF